MIGREGGFSSLTSINFSGLSSLSSVGEYWMYGNSNGFSSMTSVYVGSKQYPSIVGSAFCSSWSTAADKTIYASSWQQGGIASWIVLLLLLKQNLFTCTKHHKMQNVHIIYYMANKFTKSKKTKLIVSMLSCSLMVLGGISTVAYSLTSCSKNNPNPPYATESYYTLSSDPSTKHYFDDGNTPLENFSNVSAIDNYAYYTIDSQAISIDEICSLTFGSSYANESSIGEGFLYYTGATYNEHRFSSLSSIDFSGLHGLKEIDNYFLGGGNDVFPSLKYINFNGLSSLSSVGDYWMDGGLGGFSSLTSINFNGLNHLSSVGGWWMGGSNGGFSSLTSINFSGLSSLSCVNNGWLGCNGGGFSSLTSINFNGLNHLSSIGNNWMAGGDGGFPSLTSINFSGLSSLTTIGLSSMYANSEEQSNNPSFSSLTSINFNGLSSLSSVGDDWMNAGGTSGVNNGGFPKLVSINFLSLSNLSSVGVRWMLGANNGFSSLTSISFNGLSSLCSVGGDWMTGSGNGFANLTSINFSGLSSLSSVGNSWMNGSTNGFANMTSIEVGSKQYPANVGTGFCNAWPGGSSTIYGDTYEIASSWKQGGLTTWNTYPTPSELTDSYYTLCSEPEEHIFFSESNTPISSFCSSNYTNNLKNIYIHGEDVNIDDICSLSFGTSYSSVKTIPDGFLSVDQTESVYGSFSNLTSIDFSGLSSLSSVGNYWMDGCGDGGATDCFPKLESINFNGLSSLSSVGGNWMQGTYHGFSSLTSIDFSGLISLSSVGNSWMEGDEFGFSSLTFIDFDIPTLSSVGENWMEGYNGGFSNLARIVFSSLTNLSSVGDCWMYSEDSLSETAFHNMTSIYVGDVNFRADFSTTDIAPWAQYTNEGSGGNIYTNKSDVFDSWSSVNVFSKWTQASEM